MSLKITLLTYLHFISPYSQFPLAWQTGLRGDYSGIFCGVIWMISGLGIRKIGTFDLALLGKWPWRFGMEEHNCGVM